MQRCQLNWDVPLAIWDRGIHWDRPPLPINSKEIAMQRFKVIIDYSNLGNPRYLDKARFIVTCVTTEPLLTLVPDPFPVGIPSRVAMLAALANFQTSFDLAKDSKAAKLDRENKRAILDQMLKDFAPHLVTAAKAANDITMLEKSGYDLARPVVQSLTNGIPAAPVITVKRGKVAGSVVARVKPLFRNIKSWEGQFAVGDSTANDGFKPGVISVTGSRITFTELELAKRHQIRVRGIGSHGPGDWSIPAGIIVT
jgi:hypothetical protein